jgi:uncharacterized membrane protein YvbJ
MRNWRHKKCKGCGRQWFGSAIECANCGTPWRRRREPDAVSDGNIIYERILWALAALVLVFLLVNIP